MFGTFDNDLMVQVLVGLEFLLIIAVFLYNNKFSSEFVAYVIKINMIEINQSIHSISKGLF